MNQKQIAILKCLLKSEGCLQAEYLSKVVNISTRTVKRYIDAMNEEFRHHQIEVISIRGSGYCLQGSLEEAQALVKSGHMQENNEDRVRQMVLHLVDAESITADELARRMNFSVSTINNALPELKAVLKKYDLDIVSRPYYGMSIEGDEINIRSLLIDYGFHTKENQLFVELLNISTLDYSSIYEILLEYLKNHNIVIADRDIHSLLERIIISVSRSRQGCTEELLSTQQKKHNFDAVYEILNLIAHALSVTFSEYEYSYVSTYSGFIIYNFDSGSIGAETNIHDFLMPLLEEISMLSGIDFMENTQIIQSLSTHLSIMLTRADQHVKLKNPLLKQMKSQYAIEMNYAIFLAKKIQEAFHVTVSEDELGYLAMYFGAAQKRRTLKKRAVVICHYGVGTAQLIAEHIRQEVDGLDIVSVYPIHYLELAQAQDIDLILSTVRIENYQGDKEIIYMDNLLDSDAIGNLKKKLSQEESDLKTLLSWMHENAWLRLEASTAQEAIDKLADSMIEHQFIDQSIKQSVWEREQISSTDIGNLTAIPHTIFTGDYQSVIGVGILKKPILWNKERVQIIFMICMNQIDKTSSSAFRHLYKIIKHINTVNHLMNASGYYDFIAWMKGDRK